MAEIKMVVGLGNPGKEYAGTRHNAGFMVIDSLVEAMNRGKDAEVCSAGTAVSAKKKKFGGYFGESEFANKKLILVKPMQFMNNSGQVVATATGFYKLALSDLLVISDDMALEPGVIRIRAQGSSGGHKGLADIIEKLGTENFSRLRVGIGHSDVQAAEDYVLEEPTESQKKLLDKGIAKACEAVICWIKYGIKAAMNKFNEKVDVEK